MRDRHDNMTRDLSFGRDEVRIRIEVRMSTKQLDQLVRLERRDNPRKPWTDKERRQLAKEVLLRECDRVVQQTATGEPT